MCNRWRYGDGRTQSNWKHLILNAKKILIRNLILKLWLRMRHTITETKSEREQELNLGSKIQIAYFVLNEFQCFWHALKTIWRLKRRRFSFKAKPGSSGPARLREFCIKCVFCWITVIIFNVNILKTQNLSNRNLCFSRRIGRSDSNIQSNGQTKWNILI